jgi:hypothetical protein
MPITITAKTSRAQRFTLGTPLGVGITCKLLLRRLLLDAALPSSPILLRMLWSRTRTNRLQDRRLDFTESLFRHDRAWSRGGDEGYDNTCRHHRSGSQE